MTTKNRGKEGRDDLLFGDSKMQLKIREAVTDVSYLLSRGFAEKSAVQLVGNRYKLNARQRKAVQGMSASAAQVTQRKSKQLLLDELKDQTMIIDGFNILIILESFFSGAYVFKGLGMIATAMFLVYMALINVSSKRKKSLFPWVIFYKKHRSRRSFGSLTNP